MWVGGGCPSTVVDPQDEGLHVVRDPEGPTYLFLCPRCSPESGLKEKRKREERGEESG